MGGFLVESALLTHGLASVTDETLLDRWPAGMDCIAWVDAGEIRTGSMAAYLPFRARAGELCRIHCDTLDQALADGISGALTASGTMAVCRRLGLPLAVTGGMGGIGDIRGEASAQTSPPCGTFRQRWFPPAPRICWTFREPFPGSWRPACRSWGWDRPLYRLCLSERRCPPVRPLDGGPAAGAAWPASPAPTHPGGAANRGRQPAGPGVAAGKEAEARGVEYHPAANAAFDRLTGGYSSRIQLDSLIANARLAARLTGGQAA